MMANIHSRNGEKMPVILSLYKDPSCQEEERAPPETWLPDFLLNVAFQNVFPKFLLVSVDMHFHKLGTIIRRNECICFLFDRSIVIRNITHDEYSNENKLLLDISVERHMALTFSKGKLELKEKKNVSHYEQWVGDIVLQRSLETQLTLASLASNSEVRAACLYAKQHSLSSQTELRKTSYSPSYLAWIPALKPSSIICWLDYLSGPHSSEDEFQLNRFLKSNDRVSYCWSSISIRHSTRNISPNYLNPGEQLAQVCVLLKSKRYEGWIRLERTTFLSSDPGRKNLEKMSGKLFVELPFFFPNPHWKNWKPFTCSCASNEANAIALFLFPGYLKEYLTFKGFDPLSFLNRNSIIPGQQTKALETEIENSLETFYDLRMLKRNI